MDTQYELPIHPTPTPASATPKSVKSEDVPPENKFQGAMLFSAIGDALGWPVEFNTVDNHQKASSSLPQPKFIPWHKEVGGRWWGYIDDIKAGEYSDDTQLTLAVARSISSTGCFQPEHFAYLELPLWLHYERGGGNATKTAAKALSRRKSDWLQNFYKDGDVEYFGAGANGAVMRNLPIALVSCVDEKRLVRDSFLNTIISHGHPRAIIGTILLAQAIRHVLLEQKLSAVHMIQYLEEMLSQVDRMVADDDRIASWIVSWEKQQNAPREPFKTALGKTRDEAVGYLKAIPQYEKKPPEEYYRFIGALESSTRGSGVATACAAIFYFLQFLQNEDDPKKSVYEAAYQIGSDTDTIASLVGSLVGARYGVEIVPAHLKEDIQDREYILKIASNLHAIASGKPPKEADPPRFTKADCRKILNEWEGTLKKISDKDNTIDVINLPPLKSGIVVSRDQKISRREGYVANLIRIRFECGQTCVFHVREKKNDPKSKSLEKDCRTSPK